MTSRKEDEKNEKIIRSLLKLPDNRRCINCNSLGSQYICTNFWTFVCINCSGIHREFTHRVKSVSMAKFTSQEVKALQGGGNARAKEFYLKEWDPQRQSLPDGSNVERLRNFIKHVYVEKRYTGERSFEKPPTVKRSESEDFNDHRRTDSYQSGCQSPPYDEDHRYNDKQSSGGRSPEYDLENRQHGDYKRSPARAEVVNDWRREDRFGNETRSEDIRTSGGGSRSPDSQIDRDASSLPVVQPVREILGENITPLRIIEPPKANGIRSPDSTIRTQRTESSSSLASSNGKPAELKVEASLIDFDAVPEPHVVGAVPQPQQQAAAGLHTIQTVKSDGDNWANFDSVTDVKISHVASNLNPLESVIAELSLSASGSLNLAGNPGSGAFTNAPTNASNFSAFPTMIPETAYGSPFGSVAPAVPVNSSMPFPFAVPATAAYLVSQQPMPFGNSFASVANIRSQPQAIGGQSISQLFPVGTLGNQPSNPLIMPNPQWLHGAATVKIPQSGVRSSMGFNTGVGTQNSYQNAKPSDMKELPADLFAVNYSPVAVPVRGWNTGPQTGMGFSLQYNTPMPEPTFPQASKSTNPFDFSNDPSPAATFPSMSSLQRALPTMPAPGGQLHASSLGHPSHSSTLLYHAPPHPPLMASKYSCLADDYLGQQLSGNMPSRPHGQVQFGHEGAAFRAFNTQSTGLQSTNATPNTLSPFSGNPFG